MKEAKNNYFLIKNQLGSRRIDMMRADQEQSLRAELLLIGNSYIALKFKFMEHYMLFSQNKFDFVDYENSKLLERLTHVKDGR